MFLLGKHLRTDLQNRTKKAARQLTKNPAHSTRQSGTWYVEVYWTEKDQRNIYKAPTRAQKKHNETNRNDKKKGTVTKYTCQKKIEEGHSIKRVWYNGDHATTFLLRLHKVFALLDKRTRISRRYFQYAQFIPIVGVEKR